MRVWGLFEGQGKCVHGTSFLLAIYISAGMFFLSVLIAPQSAASQNVERPQSTAVIVDGPIGVQLDQYLSRAAAFGFSGQVVAEKEGRVLLRKAYGFAEREHRIPMTLETRLGIASMSKSFAAAAILKLEESGKLSLNDPIAQYIGGVPADKKDITIQQVVTHTAGLRGGGADDFDQSTKEEAIAAVLNKPLLFPPGSKWRYASEAYAIVAQIVAKASGQTYEEYMRNALFTPAGMTSTGFLNELHGSSSDVSHAYHGWADRGSPPEWPNDPRVFGAGDIVTTAGDLYRWEVALQSGKILSPAVLKKYFTPQVQIQGDHYYGFGLFTHKNFRLSDTRNTLTIEHGGDTELGFNSAFFRYPDENALFIVTCNARDYQGRSVRQAVDKNIERILLEVGPVPLPPASRPIADQTRPQLPGSFSLGKLGQIHIIDDGGYLWMAAEGQGAVNLLSNSSDEVNAASDLGDHKTSELLAGLIAHHAKEAYQAAMKDDNLPAAEEEGLPKLDDFLQEWERLTKANGPLRAYQVLGGYTKGEIVWVVARLQFHLRDLPMSFAWRSLARGRIGDTEPDLASVPFPVVIPLSLSENQGDLVGYDIFRDVLPVTLHHVGTLADSGWVVSAGGKAVTTERRQLVGWLPTN